MYEDALASNVTIDIKLVPLPGKKIVVTGIGLKSASLNVEAASRIAYDFRISSPDEVEGGSGPVGYLDRGWIFID